MCEASDFSACSNPLQQLWPGAHLGFRVDDDFQRCLGRESDDWSASLKVSWNKWKWRTYQAHETPTNYPGDPFEGLRHNVAKDALPVQRKS